MKAISLFAIALAFAVAAKAESHFQTDAKVLMLPASLTVEVSTLPIPSERGLVLPVVVNGQALTLNVMSTVQDIVQTIVTVEGVLKDEQGTACDVRHLIRIKGTLVLDPGLFPTGELVPHSSTVNLISEFQPDSCHSKTKIELATYRQN